MTVVPLRRRRQNHEGALVMGVFYLLGSYIWFQRLSETGRVVDWIIAGGWVFVGLWGLYDVRKVSRGVHQLCTEGDHVKILSDGQTVFDGSLNDLKRIVGDGGGFDLHPGSAYIYRVKATDIDDEWRAKLDMACA